MKQVVWIEPETVLALHDQLIALFGGIAGLRDRGLFESAMARPQQLAAYGRPTLFDLAAAYAVGFIKNHPFLDGNKRVGFVAAVLFLRLNRRHLDAGESEAVVRTLALAAGDLDEEGYAAWLERSCRSRPR